MVPAKVVQHARAGIDLGEVLGLPGGVGVPEMLEQKGMVAGLDAEDVVYVGIAQVAQMRSIGAEAVLDDDDGQVRMLLAKMFQPTAGGVTLAVVLGVAVLVDNRLGASGMTSLRSGWTNVAPRSWW